MKKYCFGVDIGGTTVKLGLFDIEGNILDKWEIKTRVENEGRAILHDTAEAIAAKISEKNIEKEEIAGVGVGAPGPVTADGYVNRTANLGWNTKFCLEGELSKLTGFKVKAGNDANVAALGEMWRGGAEGFKNVVMVTLGTGVGGGVIVDGKIITGVTGSAGEIGHMHVQDDEEDECGCGCHGCLEQYASATGVVRLAKKRLAHFDKETILKEEKLSAKSVFDAVKEGDELATEVLEQFGKYLGIALANISAIVDPEVFVFGGGVSKAGEIILDYVKKYYVPNAFYAIKDKKFVLATLGNDAGIYGAAKMVLE